MAYAWEAERLGMDPQYVADVRALAGTFKGYEDAKGPGDPDGPRHRVDDPEIIARMRQGRGS